MLVAWKSVWRIIESLAEGLPRCDLARSPEALFFAQKSVKDRLLGWFSKVRTEDCRGGVEEGYIVL